MRLKRILSVIAAAVLVISAAGCAGKQGSGSGSGGNASDDKQNSIVFIVSDTQDGSKSDFTAAIRKEAKSRGVNLVLQRTGKTVDNQVKALDVAKKDGYAGVVLWATDSSTAHQLELTAGDMPIVFVNNEPEDDDLEEGKYVYVGSPDDEAGKYEAEYVYNTLGKPQKLDLILMKGNKNATSTSERVKAIKRYFSENKVEVNYVFSDFAYDTTTSAYKMLQKFKMTGQEFDAAICTNDDMALEVIQYMSHEGLDPAKIPVCGVGGTQKALVSIAKGNLAFTVGQNSEAQAKAAISAILGLVDGHGIKGIDNASKDGRYIWVPYEKIDKSNATKYMAS